MTEIAPRFANERTLAQILHRELDKNLRVKIKECWSRYSHFVEVDKQINCKKQEENPSPCIHHLKENVVRQGDNCAIDPLNFHDRADFSHEVSIYSKILERS